MATHVEKLLSELLIREDLPEAERIHLEELQLANTAFMINHPSSQSPEEFKVEDINNPARLRDVLIDAFSPYLTAESKSAHRLGTRGLNALLIYAGKPDTRLTNVDGIVRFESYDSSTMDFLVMRPERLLNIQNIGKKTLPIVNWALQRLKERFIDQQVQQGKLFTSLHL